MSNSRDNSIHNVKATSNGIIQSIVGFLDALNIGSIYTMFLSPILLKFLEETAKYFLFPIAAGAACIQAILAWRQAYIDKGETRSLVWAGIETVSAIAITAAVIGTLVATAKFVLASPIIFTVVTVGKLVFHLGAANYYRGKAEREKELLQEANIKPDLIEKNKGMDKIKFYEKNEIKKIKQDNLALAKNHTISAGAGFFAALAIPGLFLLAATGVGQIVLATVGIVGAVAGAGLAVYYGYKNFKAAQSVKKQMINSSNGLSSVSEKTGSSNSNNMLHNTTNMQKTMNHNNKEEESPLILDSKKGSNPRTMNFSKPRVTQLGLYQQNKNNANHLSTVKVPTIRNSI